MSELEGWQGTNPAESNAENAESNQNGSREGYRPFNRENQGMRPRFNNNQGDRSRRPRMNNTQHPYNNPTDREQGFRPEGFGHNGYNTQGGQRYAPRNPFGYDNQGRQYNRPNNGYGSNGYRPRSRNDYNDNYEGGGYGSHRGGYNNGGYNASDNYGAPQRRTYGNRPGSGGYNPHQQRGAYGLQRTGGYNRDRSGGYGQQRPQRPYKPNHLSMKKRIEYKEYLEDPNAPIRLNKFLANAGICSRREADQFIEAGVIKVNGEVVTELGTKVQRTDTIHFHDQLISLEKKVYVILNKPKDYVTTSDDPQQRKTVMELVKNACRERIYPVGRLDRNTTGVLLFTNDGDLASKLTHPKFLKKKIYHVHLDKNASASDLKQIADGITLEDGEVHADAVSYASDTDKKQVGIEIHSGKNRIVRRIFESLGYRVLKLDRVMFAGLTKKGLKRGDWRFLTEQEVAMLHMGSFE